MNTKADEVCKTCKNSDMLLPKCFYLKLGYYIPNNSAADKDKLYE